MNFKAALITEAALNLKNWEGVEWFGIDELYVPYPYIDEYALAFCESDMWGNFELEVSESFPYLAAYKCGEFLCTLELPFICYTGQVIFVTDFELRLKVPKGAKLY